MAKNNDTPALALIRFKAQVAFPYFSKILFGLIAVEKKNDPVMKTMAVDKYMRLYYNPDMLDHITVEEAVGCLIHEVNHLIRGHLERGEHYDPVLFNIAGDLEINDDITRDANCGVKLPTWVLYPKNYNLPDDQIAEWYYSKIKVKKIPVSGIGGGGCGSCSNGQPDPNELPYDGSSNDGHSKTMVEFYKKATAEDIRDEAAKARGTVPAYLERWAKEYLRAKIDWKKELRATIVNMINCTAGGMTDYSRQKLSRRQASNPDFILPGFVQPVPKVACIIDTSGSMSDKFISQCLSEVGDVLRNTNTDVVVVDVDAEVNHIGKVKDRKQIKLAGGGGTNMCKGYEALARYREKVNIVILLSDMMTPFPEKPLPHTKNIFCALVNKREDGVPGTLPSWGKVVVCPANE